MAAECETPVLNAFSSFQPSAKPQRLRAVVVDDSREYLDVTCALLQLEDVIDVVGRAENGADAIHAVAHLQPDLLIMDVQMPLVNGLSAATFVSVEFPSTKIILISSDDSLPLRDICEVCGAHAFIPKGRFRQEFMLTLRAIFQESRATQRP